MITRPQPEAEIMLEVRLNKTRTREESQLGYEALYSQAGHIAQSDSFYMWLLDLLALQPGELFLDVSCGQAELPRLAQEREINAFGMDLSHNALLTGRTQMHARNLVTSDSQQLPYKSNSFDVISNLGSLEHYLDMGQAVQEMARTLKPGGRAFVLVPNTFSLMTNVWIAFRQGRTSIDPYQPIQRYAARYEWQDLLEGNGLVVTRTQRYESVRPRTWPDFLDYLRRPKQLVRLLLSPFIPLNLVWAFVFVCRKADDLLP